MAKGIRLNQMTGREVAGGFFDELGLFRAAAVGGERTARVEAAAGRNIRDRLGSFWFDGFEFLGIAPLGVARD